MKNNLWTIKNETYKKVNKTQAEKYYNAGVPVYLCFANCNPNYIGAPFFSVDNSAEESLLAVSKAYIHYNYTGGIGWKKYLWFFVKVKNK